MNKAEKEALMKANEELQKEWNKSVFTHIRSIQAIAKPNVNDVKGVERACKDYFTLCEENRMRPSVSGLALALGVNRSILLKWLNGEITIQTADVIMEYFSLIEIFDETALKDNKTNPVAGLFNMKNNFGYKDEVEHHIIEDKKPTNKELEEKYIQRQEIIDAKPVEIDYTRPQKPVEKTPVIVPTDDEEVPF